MLWIHICCHCHFNTFLFCGLHVKIDKSLWNESTCDRCSLMLMDPYNNTIRVNIAKSAISPIFLQFLEKMKKSQKSQFLLGTLLPPLILAACKLGHISPDNTDNSYIPGKNKLDICWNKILLLRTLANEDTDSRSLQCPAIKGVDCIPVTPSI